jgi:hypothetical protein
MAEPRVPYYVSFSTDRIPTVVDHSSSNPGPSGTGANRAGWTRTNLSASGGPEFVPRTGPARADGKVPFYFQSINVRFTLGDFIVKISSDYSVRSCAYNATRRHEFDAHLYRPIRIFLSYRDPLIERLNAVTVPTQTAPQWALPTGVAALQEGFEDRVKEAVYIVYKNLKMALHTARDEEDDAEHYSLVYDQCSPSEWLRR